MRARKKSVASIGDAEADARPTRDMAFILVPPNQPLVQVEALRAYARRIRQGVPFRFRPPICQLKAGQPNIKAVMPKPVEAHTRRRPGWTNFETVRAIDMPLSSILSVSLAFRILYGFPEGDGRLERFPELPISTSPIKQAPSRRAGPLAMRRPAGLPIFPAVVRYDEIQSPRDRPRRSLFTISANCAKRLCLSGHSFRQQVDRRQLPRMGERLRLRHDFDTSKFFFARRPRHLEALKRYGMFVAETESSGPFPWRRTSASPQWRKNFEK